MPWWAWLVLGFVLLASELASPSGFYETVPREVASMEATFLRKPFQMTEVTGLIEEAVKAGAGSSN